MAPTRAAAALRLAAWSALLVFTLRLLHGPVFGHLAIPMGSTAEFAGWVDTAPPVVMAVALARLAAIVAAWYLLAATVLAVLANVSGWRCLARLLAAVTPSVVRRLAARSAGVGLVAGALVAATPMPQRLLAVPGPADAVSATSRSPAGAAEGDGPPLGWTSAASRRPSPDGDGPAMPAPTSPRHGPRGDDPATATMARTSAAPTDSVPAPPERATTGAAAVMSRLPSGADGPLLPGMACPAIATMTRHPRSAAAGMTSRPPATPPTDTASPTDTAPPRAVAPPTGTAPPPAAAPPAGTAPPAGAMPSSGDGPPADPGRGPGHDLANRPPPSADPFARAGDETWIVEAGDSFWSIAADTLAEHRSDATDDQITRYWALLIAANRDRLADPDNPDLLLPSQELVVVPPP